MNRVFNPFEKPFSDVKEADLKQLNGIAEGWYIEYKQGKQNGDRIGKSISSFSNSYGGIYFIGISTQNNLPVKFDGVQDSPDVIQNSVRGNVQPFPYFETYTIKLSNGNHIIMAIVPEGQDPPYIHSSGKIYRRQEAASDPIEETNRYAIDQLYEKSRSNIKKIEEFRQIEYSFCNAEDFPYLEIFVNTVPFNRFLIKDIYNLKNLEELYNKFKEEWSIKEKIGEQEPIISGSIPFNIFNTYHHSFVCRNLMGNDTRFNGLTLEFDCFGNCKLLYPIPIITDANSRYLQFLGQYSESDSIRILDSTSIFTFVIGLLSKYIEVLKGKGYTDEIEIMIGLENTYRTTLYIDNEKFFDFIEKYGLPICMIDDQVFPPKAIRKNIEEFIKHPIIETAIIFGNISNALGISSEVTIPAIYTNLTKEVKK